MIGWKVFLEVLRAAFPRQDAAQREPDRSMAAPF
jgi:hypothetical protein